MIQNPFNQLVRSSNPEFFPLNFSWYVTELIENNKKSSNKELNELKKSLSDFCDKSVNKYPIQMKTQKIKDRDKKVNAKTFHDGGICVPVDSNGFGYRDLPETYGIYFSS